MKKTFFLSLILSTTVIFAAAQNVRFSVSAGLSLAKIDYKADFPFDADFKYKTGFDGGIGAEFGIAPKFAIGVEANYSMQGSKIDQGGDEGSLKMDYITVPVLARINAVQGLSFYVGPQIGFLLSAKAESGGVEDDIKDQLKSTDFYGVIGAEYRLPMGVFFTARYNLGFGQIVEDESAGVEIKNRYFAFRLGYSFPIGGK